ncbi:MAG: beta-lactamase class A [Roseivirga sp.]
MILSGDSTQENGKSTVAHMIKKIFLVSDSEAYNYLFELLGRDYINQELQKRNIRPAHINHKFQSGAKNTMALSFFYGRRR